MEPEAFEISDTPGQTPGIVAESWVCNLNMQRGPYSANIHASDINGPYYAQVAGNGVNDSHEFMTREAAEFWCHHRLDDLLPASGEEENLYLPNPYPPGSVAEFQNPYPDLGAGQNLAHVLTTYDRKESTKRGYNRYALGQYMMALERVRDEMAEGKSLRHALTGNFTGRLLDVLLKAVGEPKATDRELRYGNPGMSENPRGVGGVPDPDLFIGVYSTGISYADRSREEHGDYKKIAFLPFSTLKLEVWDSKSKLLPDIRRDAKSLQRKKGQEFRVSTSGQTVVLGKKNPSSLPPGYTVVKSGRFYDLKYHGHLKGRYYSRREAVDSAWHRDALEKDPSGDIFRTGNPGIGAVIADALVSGTAMSVAGGLMDRVMNPGKWILPYRRNKINLENVGHLPLALEHDTGFAGDKLYRVAKVLDAAGSYTRVSRSFRNRKEALAEVKRMAAGGERRRNPSTSAASAAAMFETFHGAPSKHVTEFETSDYYRGNLAQLGTLTEMKIKTESGYKANLDFEGDGVILSASPDGRQLYLTGGNQFLDLKSLHMSGSGWERDDMVIGDLIEITYRTRKGFDSFRLIDYYHKLGEESKVVPKLIYDRLNKALRISGGQYDIKPEGIVN